MSWRDKISSKWACGQIIASWSGSAPSISASTRPTCVAAVCQAFWSWCYVEIMFTHSSCDNMFTLLGVHGGLMVFESRFTSSLLADILMIPASKTLLRRHLNTLFADLIGAARRQHEQQHLAASLNSKNNNNNNNSTTTSGAHKASGQDNSADTAKPLTASSRIVHEAGAHAGATSSSSSSSPPPAVSSASGKKKVMIGRRSTILSKS